MSTNDDLIEVLNDLIQINNDRTKGFETASKDAKNMDVDLHATFNKMADDSRKFVAELTGAVQRLGGDAATGTTAGGKIHRAWIDVKATFTGNSRQALLDSCEFGEDHALEAYDEAMESDAEMNAETRNMIAEQRAAIQKEHDLIKKYRDMNEKIQS
jgi:uncharacterized protein (TIGR02284 family)